MAKEVLGIGIHGVVIQIAEFFPTPDYQRTKEYPGAFAAIRELQARFGTNINLISCCEASIQEKTTSWLLSHGFHAMSGIRPKNVYFCRKISDHSDICQKLKITHFIHTRLDVLDNTNVRKLILLHPDLNEIRETGNIKRHVRLFHSWEEISQDMTKDHRVIV